MTHDPLDPPLSPDHGLWLTPVSGGDQTRRVVEHLVRRNAIHESSFALFRTLTTQQYQAGPPPLCLDLGANQGHSVVSLHRVCPRLRVICFEPLPWAVDSLAVLGELARFGTEFSFEVQPVALGDRDGQLDLWIPGSKSHMLTTQASSDSRRAGSESTLRYLQLFFAQPLERQTVHRFSLPLRRLDDFGLAPQAIKIDVEEAELAVLAGAERTIGAHRPLLLIETGPGLPLISETLSRHGYRPFQFDEAANHFVPYAPGSGLKGNTAYITAAHVASAKAAGAVAADLEPWE